MDRAGRGERGDGGCTFPAGAGVAVAQDRAQGDRGLALERARSAAASPCAGMAVAAGAAGIGSPPRSPAEGAARRRRLLLIDRVRWAGRPGQALTEPEVSPAT